MSYTELNAVRVHNGLSYSEAAEDGDDAWVVGFGCAHPFDAPDPELNVDSFFSQLVQELISMGGTVCTAEYVTAECENLCEQAHAAQPRLDTH